MSNGTEQRSWYHQPLWSGIIGGVAVAALISLSGFIGGGGLIGALGGVTKSSLGDEMEKIKRDHPEIWAALQGEPGAQGEQGPPGSKGAPGPVGTANIPAGAIVAFDLPSGCPEGWTAFEDGAGRTIIGAGQGMTDVNGKALSSRKYRGHGGEEEHTLTTAEMPKHGHNITSRIQRSTGSGNNVTRSVAFGEGSAPARDWTDPAITIVDAGGQQSHNNMPPYIALHFCKYEGAG